MTLAQRSLALFTLTLFSASAVRAQPPPPDDEESLIKRGNELRKHGHDEEALALFQRAYAQSHSPRAQAQVGLAEQALGRWPEAVDALESALATRDAWIEQRRMVLEGALRVAAPRVGRIALAGGIDGAQVQLDGAPAGTLPLSRPLAVAPGEHRVLVEQSGYQPFAGRAQLAAGQTLTLEVALAATPVALPASDKPRSRKALWIGLAAGGAAALAIGLGLGLGLRGKNFDQQATNSCRQPCMVVQF